jgi:hypothetical protein
MNKCEVLKCLHTAFWAFEKHPKTGILKTIVKMGKCPFCGI